GRYDHTVLTDFLKVHGASITPLIGQLRWLLLVWLIFSVFMNAGMLFCVYSEAKFGKTFWKGGARYFFPFLKISLIMLLFIVVWTALILIPMTLFFEPSLQYFSAENYTVWLVLILVFVYLIGLVILFVWSVISRLLKIHTGHSIAACIKNGWRIVRNNKSGFLGLMLCFVVLQIILLAIYWALEAFTGMTTSGLILLLFMVQQIFVFFRIQLRLMMYSGIGSLAIIEANK
ncbi:MAG: hypothetical protein Q7T20_19055, partial [Saprospiraceae bacterium]|nr:hypothetical protein [Saprospiraceae bacterium]